jgi:hypothetical protein
MNITNNATMFLKLHGKLFKVIAIAKTVEAANKLCDEHSNLGVIAESVEDGLIYLCDMEDNGIPA